MNVERRCSAVMCVVAAQIALVTTGTMLTLPAWGLAAALWSRMGGWRFVALVMVQIALWFTILVALLPTVS